MEFTATVEAKGAKFLHTVFCDGEVFDTRTSKRRYNFAIIWKIGDEFVPTYSAKPERPGRVNQYGWIVSKVLEIA